MFSFLSKFIFLRKKPKVIVVAGKNAQITTDAIFFTLRDFFSIKKISKDVPKIKEVLKNQVLLFELRKIKYPKRLIFWLRNSSLPILVIDALSEIPPMSVEKEIAFASERVEELEELSKALPPFGYLLLNFDDETVREIGDKINVYSLTFGFGEKAEFLCSDCRITKDGTIFKLNFKGNVLPIWLSHIFGKKNIESVLAVLAIAQVLNCNLVKISQIIKHWQGVEGEGKLVEGVNETFLLDDSKNASAFSMLEMLEILGKLGSQTESRRVAVLGDILGLGKYTIQAHETIGEKLLKRVDLLFTVGQRAKFIAEFAKERGFKEERIFTFDDVFQATTELKKQVKQGDIILIDGSSEMQMSEIVSQMKKP